jgi:hypothetical protein
MVQYNQDGLSAVANFFGGNVDDAAGTALDDSTLKDSASQQPSTSKAGKKLGLGASRVVDEEEQKSSELMRKGATGKLMRMVNRSKQQDEDDNSVDDTSDCEVDDEIEEEGRNSAFKDGSTSKKRSDILGSGSDAVKKLTKKSRKRVGRDTNPINAEGDAIVSSEGEKYVTNNDLNATNKAEDTNHVNDAVDGEEMEVTTNRGKRPKKRSRQKNIRKDTRGHNRPGHLIPGRSDFSGRGLTAETRKAMNLPPKSKYHSKAHDEEKKPENHDFGLSLGVDDLLGQPVSAAGDDLGVAPDEKTGGQDVNSVKKVKESKGKPRKKTRKSKYKNLR